MNKQDLLELALNLHDQYQNDLRKPFPYKDARKLVSSEPNLYEAFIPDLDQYFSKIAGYASWGEDIFNWSSQKVVEVTKNLQFSFFDRYDKYKALQEDITFEDTPDLFNALAKTDSARVTLLRIMTTLENDVEL